MDFKLIVFLEEIDIVGKVVKVDTTISIEAENITKSIEHKVKQKRKEKNNAFLSF